MKQKVGGIVEHMNQLEKVWDWMQLVPPRRVLRDPLVELWAALALFEGDGGTTDQGLTV